MSKLLTVTCASAVLLALGFAFERARMRRFWGRTCTGREWRRRFPKAPKADIREFLDLFIAAFGFGESRRLQFAPEDRVMEVYRALYPFPKMTADSMELESFMVRVEERYGIDLLPLWREDITLGDLFAYARADLA